MKSRDREMAEAQAQDDLLPITMVLNKQDLAQAVLDLMQEDWAKVISGEDFSKLETDPSKALLRHTPQYIKGMWQMFGGGFTPAIGQKMMKALQEGNYKDLKDLADVYKKMADTMKQGKTPLVSLTFMQDGLPKSNIEDLIID